MKKFLALLLAAIMLLSMVAMVACGEDPVTPPDEKPDDETPGDDKPECTHEDANIDGKCDKCGAQMEIFECTHEDADSDYKCDKCGAEMTPEVDPDDQEAADKVVELIEKIEEITKDNYSSFKSKISNARKRYDKLTDAQKALISEDLVKRLTDAETNYEFFKAAADKAESLTVNKLLLSSPTVDGLLNVEYILGAALSVSTEAGTSVTFRFLLDEEYLYIIEDRKDAMLATPSDYNVADGDNSILYFTKDGEQVAGLYWNPITAKNSSPVIALFGTDKNAAEVKDYESALAIAGDGKACTVEAKIPLADLGFTKKDFEDSLIGLTFVAHDADGTTVHEMKHAGVDAWDDCERFFTAKPLLVNLIANGTPEVDGRLDDLYMQSNYIELSQSACDEFTEEQLAVGAGIKGAPELATPDFELMHSTFRFAIDDEYLYIAEHRYDLVPIYKTLSFKEPYKADGSLLWFTTNGSGKPSVGIDWNRATMDSSKPVLGLYFNDDQKSAVKKDWECVVKNCGSEFEYIMEAKIPLSDLGLTKAQFEEAKVSFTFITVDVINPQYDPSLFDWTDNAYQLQYIGVNSWDHAPILMVNPSNSDVGYLPIVDPYDPEYDLEDTEIAEKPFDSVPVDPETGFITTEYRYLQYANWFSDMKSQEWVYTKDPADVFPETIVNTANWNSGVGHYTDGDKQIVLKIDLNTYKNAIIVLELAQNYDIRVSTDSSIETMDPSEMYDFIGWTKVQDYVEVHGERTTSGSLHHAIAIEANAFAEGSDCLYVRIGNCGNTEGHGGSCYNFSIFYTED